MSSHKINMLLLSTFSTMPAFFAFTAIHASRAITLSIPVPTIGASFVKSGTAWRCIFEPISARLASSCSKKGIKDAVTPTIIPEHKSIKFISSLLASMVSPSCLASINSSLIIPLLSIFVEAGAIKSPSSCVAVR